MDESQIRANERLAVYTELYRMMLDAGVESIGRADIVARLTEQAVLVGRPVSNPWPDTV